MRFNNFYLLVFTISVNQLNAQLDTTQQYLKLQQNIELMAEQSQIDGDDMANLLHSNAYYLNNKINLNTATKSQLQASQLFSDIQINALLEHIEKNGALINIYELQSIKEFNLAFIHYILPYVNTASDMTEKYFNIKECFKYGKHELVLSSQRVIEEQQGFKLISDSVKQLKPNSYYLGDPYRQFLKYRFQYNQQVSVGFSAEKDAGELFYTNSKLQGFDFYSGHIAINDVSVFKQIIVGDYQAKFGQGLTLYKGFAFNRSTQPMSSKRNLQGLSPYYSMDEMLFFRGIATKFELKHFSISTMLSHKNIDAGVINADSINRVGEPYFTQFQLGGYHNTQLLLQNKHTVQESIFANNVSFDKRNLHIGSTMHYTKFDKRYEPNTYYYNQFAFIGNSQFIIGTDYNWVYYNVNLYGEIALNPKFNKAFCQGMIVALDHGITLSAHYRQFDKEFNNLHANAFAEKLNMNGGEEGLFVSAEFKVNAKHNIFVSADQYKLKWLGYNNKKPMQGTSFLTQYNFLPNKVSNMYFRWQHTTLYEDVIFTNYKNTIAIPKNQITFYINQQIHSDISFKTRLDYAHVQSYQNVFTSGVAFTQDLKFKKMHFPMSFTMRYVYFDVQNYLARIYVFEDDVLYSNAIPMLYNKGHRVAFICNWLVLKHFDVWFKISTTVYDNTSILSEGSLSQIDANQKSEIKLQARLKF